MSKYPSLLAGALLLACGSAVDVGQDHAEHWSDAPDAAADPSVPQVLFQGRARIVAFTVDESHIFALLEDDARARVRLISCPIERCQSERTTLFEAHAEGASEATPLLLANGVLYWLTTNSASDSVIVSCSATNGCSQGPELVVPNKGGSRGDFACDGEFIYWLDTPSFSVLRRRVAPDAPIELVYAHVWDGPFSWPERVTEYGDYLYLHDGEQLFRVPKHGEGEPEMVAERPNLGAVSASASGLHFATSTLIGSLFRCPLEGCAGAEDELARNQRWPAALQVDARAVFWLNAPMTYLSDVQTALVTCTLPECDDTRTLATDNLSRLHQRNMGPLSSVLALNQRFVFWQGGEESADHFLRRLSR